VTTSHSRPESKRRRSRIAAEKSESSKLDARLTADLDALTRMHELSRRLLEPGGLEPLLREVMDAAVAIMHAERGTLQLLEGNSLRIVASHGHQRPFLEFFASAETRASACGEAMTCGKRLIVPDVETSSLFVGTASLAVLRDAGVRAVQSTPMVSRTGALLGILTTQWATPHNPDEHDLRRIDLLVRQAADLIESKQATEALQESEQRLRQIAQAGRIGFFEWNASRDTPYWNTEHYEIFGYEAGSPITYERWLASVHPDDRELANRNVAQLMERARTGEQGYAQRYEYRIIRDGAVRWLESDATLDIKGEETIIRGCLQDVTESKQSKEALRESEERLRIAHELSPDGFTILRPVRDEQGHVFDFTYVYENAAIARLNGTDPAAVVGRRVLEVNPSHAQSPFHKAYQQVAESKQSCVLEAPWHFQRAEEKWVRVAVVPCGNDIAIFGQDITERKQAEEALRESDERLRLALDAARLGTWDWHTPSGRVFWNDEHHRLLGHEPGTVEPTYRAWAARVHPQDLPRVEALLNQTMARGEEYAAEYRIVRPDGTVRWVEARGRCHRDMDGEGVRYGVLWDITERKHAEEAQRESEARLRAIISTLPVGVAVMDAAGRTVLTNETMDQIWAGAERSPVFTSSIVDTGRFRGWWASSGVQLGAEDWASSRALAQGETSVGEVIDIERMDGTRGTILNNAGPLHDMRGNVNGAVVAVMDITELTQAQKALKEADRHKDEFLAMLAHELRNPLAAITSAIELLKLRGPADPTLVRARNSALRQAAHMTRLLDDLLDVARATQGKVTLNKENVSLHSIVESAIEASNPLVNARNHRLYVSHPRVPMWVYGDPVRLSQAIGNLLHNSAKYTPPGGEIYLAVEREGEQAVISVRDNGRGIDAELLPHIFDLFVQASRSPDRSEGGLGIGLTLVRSIVELHGGRVEARSEGPDKGSEFRTWLPLLPATEKDLADTGAEKVEQTKPLQILIVDDNVDSAELVSVLLELQGHKVMVANSGPEAIDMALKEIPEVALIDIGMPGMDGYEVARRLRESPELKHTALVAVTGYGQQEDIERSRDAGFDDHLVKPVDIETLNRVLRKVDQNTR
jgi:PAS domain S-box-containing protein